MYQRLLGDDNIFPAAGGGREGWERGGGDRKIRSSVQIHIASLLCQMYENTHGIANNRLKSNRPGFKQLKTGPKL